MRLRTLRAIVFVWLLLSATTSAQNSSGFGPSDFGTGTSRVSGQVVSADSGAPLPGATVTIAENHLPGARSRTSNADAGGAFEFPGVPAGTYSLSAAKPGYLLRTFSALEPPRGVSVTVAAGQSATSTIAMTRSAAISGRVVDALGEPVARVLVTAQRFQYGPDGSRDAWPAGTSDLSDDLGQFRIHGLPPGDFVVVATLQNGPRANSLNILGTNPEYAPTFYPGTIRPADAQIISLAPGQESAAPLTLVSSRLVRIAGTAVTSNGAPAVGATVRLRPRTQRIPSIEVLAISISERPAGTVSQDGTFEIARVPPGEYWIEVCCAQRGTEGASSPISVLADDLSGVSIVTTPGVTVRGSVVFETARPEGTFQLNARSPDGPLPGLPQGAISSVDADGGFALERLSGRVIFEPINKQWAIKSIVLDGRELLDEPLELAGRNTVTGLRITVTDRQTQVSGEVKDERGQALKEHVVVLLRTDAVPALPSQAVRMVRTGDAGRVHLVGLRPGTYVIGVVEDLEPGHQFSPDFQERLRNRGRRFSLDEGEGVVLDLTPTSGLQ